MTAAEINSLFGVTESFMLLERLMALLFSDGINDIFERYSGMQGNLSYDGFTDYFQEEHSNRKAMMQDFTPKELAQLVGRIATDRTEVRSCLDVCAGTGGLTIALHSVCPECVFWCEELSKRAVPLLLFNLAVRNIPAYVTNKDVLSGEVFGAWQVVPGERFGAVVPIECVPETPVDICVTNPPYSLKYEFDEKKPDSRFDGFGYPPKQFADYAFILHGLSRLKDGGRLAAILPHGVLFRGNREADIRRKLIEKGLLHAVIGLPDNLFLNTGIPVAVLVFGKSTAERLVFIDGSKGFAKTGKINQLRTEDVEKILSALASGEDIPKYSHIAKLDEIAENGCNLNISRYVDTFEPPPPIDIVEVTWELIEIKREREALEEKLCGMISDMVASDEKTSAELDMLARTFSSRKVGEKGQIHLEELP
nr:MAG TPA: N-6 DNA Methylase [Caudoviricetes sp.]